MKFGKFFRKFFSKILNFQKKISNFFFMHNVPSKIASLLKFWWASGFQWANRQNLTEMHFVVFWTEYAINEKNIWCHVFSCLRPTYFSLDKLNPWLPNLLYWWDCNPYFPIVLFYQRGVKLIKFENWSGDFTS